MDSHRICIHTEILLSSRGDDNISGHREKARLFGDHSNTISFTVSRSLYEGLLMLMNKGRASRDYPASVK